MKEDQGRTVVFRFAAAFAIIFGLPSLWAIYLVNSIAPIEYGSTSPNTGKYLSRLMDRISGEREQSRKKAQRGAAAGKAYYNPDFTENVIGQLPDLHVRAYLSSTPVTNWQGSCLSWLQIGGTATKFNVFTRKSFDGPFTLGNPDEAWQIRFRPTDGSLVMAIERRRGDGSCN